MNILLGGELATLKVSQKVEHAIAHVRQRLNQENRAAAADRFLDVMSTRYLSACRPVDIVRHVEMARALEGSEKNHDPSRFLLEATKDDSEECFEMTFLARDRPGLFSDIAGVLALNNLNVLSSDIFTWRDGTAVDIFRVTAPLDPIHPNRTWDKVRRDLDAVFSGSLSLAYRLGQKGSSEVLPENNKPFRPPQVKIDNGSSDFFTIIEVFANDQVKRLYAITKILMELRLDIRIAKIATRGDQIADIFYVRDFEGRKIEDKAHLKEIEDALLFELNP